jgi:superfamily I DNA/RNA helicase
MLVEVVKEYGKKIPGYIKMLKESHLDHNDKDKADMIFSTVHRCKGMEYDEVTLADDFITEKKLVDMVGGEEAVNTARLGEEINLLYVAVTRTKSDLYVSETIFPDAGKHADKPLKNVYLLKSAEKKYGHKKELPAKAAKTTYVYEKGRTSKSKPPRDRSVKRR